MVTSGIYKIENLINGKCYIGSTKDFNSRWYRHSSDLQLNKHSNPHLQNAYHKWGKENLIFYTIECVEDKSNLVEREQHHIDSYDFDKLYNIRPTAASNLGIKRSEEVKKKMSEARSGENHYLFGKHHSEMTKKKLSETKLGKNNPMYGKHHSPETKKKMSQAQVGEKSHMSKMITFNGKTQNIKSWAEEIGVKYTTLVMRLNKYGWTIERALTTHKGE